ncbi:DUF5995 family protein [Nocardia sp. NPDC058499]|uniref:DUF5995 family protein n=1 Tax=Nocardia sp. NPDC058499 TaxID=3346530 RepID=UPI003654DC40
MRSTLVRGILISSMTVVALLGQVQPASAAPGDAAVAAACGEPLDAAEVSEIATLSDLETPPSGPSLPRLEATADRLNKITRILARKKDRRATFAIGLDALEQDAILPLQRKESEFDDPDYAHRLSIEVMSYFLTNLHGEFTGGPVEPHWGRHFELARNCDISLGHVTMAGYNAHFTVDMPNVVAAIGSQPANARDYFTVLDTISANRNVIVDPTEAVFGDAVGRALVLLAGDRVARIGFNGFNAINFATGLALQSNVLRGATEAEINLAWRAIDTAVKVF